MNPDVKRPPISNKPTVPRPQFHVFGQHRGSIRGISIRCQWCAGMMPMNTEVCPWCGSTQIDEGLIDLSSAPDWKRRLKLLGKSEKGYTGV